MGCGQSLDVPQPGVAGWVFQRPTAGTSRKAQAVGEAAGVGPALLSLYTWQVYKG